MRKLPSSHRSRQLGCPEITKLLIVQRKINDLVAALDLTEAHNVDRTAAPRAARWRRHREQVAARRTGGPESAA